MASNRILLDGRYATGFYSGRVVTEWPFTVNGDLSAQIRRRQYRIRESTYQPPQLGITRDPDSALAYLVAESAPTPTGFLDVLAAEHTFATLPAAQTWYDKPTITKPTAGSAGGTETDSFIGRVIFYDSVDASLPIGYPIYYGGYLFVNNEVFGPIKTSTSANSGADTRLSSTAHGVAGTERLTVFFTSGGLRTFDAGEYTVVDPDTLDLLGVNWGANVPRLARKHRDYSPGSFRVAARMTQAFYLAGVSPGIATDADIPTPTERLNDGAFIDAVIATLSGYVDYSATDLGRWPSEQSPIRTVTTTAIDFADL